MPLSSTGLPQDRQQIARMAVLSHPPVDNFHRLMRYGDGHLLPRLVAAVGQHSFIEIIPAQVSQIDKRDSPKHKHQHKPVDGFPWSVSIRMSCHPDHPPHCPRTDSTFHVGARTGVYLIEKPGHISRAAFHPSVVARTQGTHVSRYRVPAQPFSQQPMFILVQKHRTHLFESDLLFSCTLPKCTQHIMVDTPGRFTPLFFEPFNLRNHKYC